MLLHIGACNSNSNKNENGKSVEQTKDAQWQAKDLSHVHSGGPQEQTIFSE